MYKRRGSGMGRFIAVFSMLMVLVSGVTFAALQSQNAVVKGSRITSATVNLQVGDNPNNFGAMINGFDFSNIEPGGPAAPKNGHSLFLRNNGTTDLALRLVVNPNTFVNTSDANLDRIFINITPVTGPHAGQLQQLSLATLLNAYNGTPLGLEFNLAAGQTAQYSLQVQIANDALSSPQSGVAMSGIDLIFSGRSIVD